MFQVLPLLETSFHLILFSNRRAIPPLDKLNGCLGLLMSGNFLHSFLISTEDRFFWVGYVVYYNKTVFISLTNLHRTGFSV